MLNLVHFFRLLYLSNTDDVDVRSIGTRTSTPSCRSGKLALRYERLRDIESMRSGACAHQTRDLVAFEQTARQPRRSSSGLTIRSCLTAPYDVLWQNLLRIIEPYLVVEIEYAARQDDEACVLLLFL